MQHITGQQIQCNVVQSHCMNVYCVHTMMPANVEHNCKSNCPFSHHMFTSLICEHIEILLPVINTCTFGFTYWHFRDQSQYDQVWSLVIMILEKSSLKQQYYWLGKPYKTCNSSTLVLVQYPAHLISPTHHIPVYTEMRLAILRERDLWWFQESTPARQWFPTASCGLVQPGLSGPGPCGSWMRGCPDLPGCCLSGCCPLWPLGPLDLQSNKVLMKSLAIFGLLHTGTQAQLLLLQTYVTGNKWVMSWKWQNLDNIITRKDTMWMTHINIVVTISSLLWLVLTKTTLIKQQ